MAIQPPRARRTAEPRRPHPHGRRSAQWPGLVALLNLNGSLTKANVPYATLWSEAFDDDRFVARLREWRATGRVAHPDDHVHPLAGVALPEAGARVGRAVAARLLDEKAILGMFDEGCMGMYNAILDDELLNPLGVYKERLSQSALVAEMATVSDAEAAAVRSWLNDRGVAFAFGPDEATDLTPSQVHAQAKMYVAAVRLADRFDCDAIGIQYQQGLADLTPASDLVEGPLNASDRPPCARGTAASSTPAPCSRTSTRSTRGPPSTRWSPTGRGRRSASTPRPRSTTCAGASSSVATASMRSSGPS